MPTYVEIPDLYVPADARIAAWRARETHVARLALPWGRPPIRWVDDLTLMNSAGRLRAGLMTPGRTVERHNKTRSLWGWATIYDALPAIYLNVRQPIDQVPRTVSH